LRSGATTSNNCAGPVIDKRAEVRRSSAPSPAAAWRSAATVESRTKPWIKLLRGRTPPLVASTTPASARPATVVSHVPSGIDQELVLQNDVVLALLNAHSREFLPRFFHVADANTVDLGRNGGEWMLGAVSPLERRRSSFQIGEVSLEAAVINQAVPHHRLIRGEEGAKKASQFGEATVARRAPPSYVGAP